MKYRIPKSVSLVKSKLPAETVFLLEVLEAKLVNFLEFFKLLQALPTFLGLCVHITTIFVSILKLPSLTDYLPLISVLMMIY